MKPYLDMKPNSEITHFNISKPNITQHLIQKPTFPSRNNFKAKVFTLFLYHVR